MASSGIASRGNGSPGLSSGIAVLLRGSRDGTVRCRLPYASRRRRVLPGEFHPPGKASLPPAANTGGRKIKSNLSERSRLPLARASPAVDWENAAATDFTGQTALITGAGRGISRAIALGLAGTGARLVLLARTAGQLEETSGTLREQGVPAGRIGVVPADLAAEGQRAVAVASVLAAGRVDVLINNTGLRRTQHDLGQHGLFPGNDTLRKPQWR